MRLQNVLISALASLFLASCGGGSADTQTSSITPTTPSGIEVVGSVSLTKPGLQLSSETVTTTVEQGDPPPKVAIDGVVNEALGPVYVYVSRTGTGIDSVAFEKVGEKGGRLLISGGLRNPGVYEDTIQVDVCYDWRCEQPVLGSPKSVKVNSTVYPARTPAALIPNLYGVAFASIPMGSRLTQELTVEQTGETIHGWTATADVQWLILTQTGTSNNRLRITADPSGMPEGLHSAIVTLTPNDQGHARTAQIRVGLYISTKASAPEFDQKTGDSVLVDPSRPLVFSLSDSKILIDHVHTGRRLLAAGIPGVRFSEMALTSDGSRIVLIDADQPRAWTFNTYSNQFTGFIPFAPRLDEYRQEARRTPIVFRANGREILALIGYNVSGDKQTGYHMLDLDNKVSLKDVFTAAFWEYDTVQVAKNTHKIYVQTNLSPSANNWVEFTENSNGRIIQSPLERTMRGLLVRSYLSRSQFVSSYQKETITCQGVIRPLGIGDWAEIDTTLIQNFRWSTDTSHYPDEMVNRMCSEMAPYGDNDQFLMTKDGLKEIQARTRNGDLIGVWQAPAPLEGKLQVSSDQMRAFGREQFLVDLTPRN